MRESIERKIIKRLYRSYKEVGKVLKFPAAQIFREFGIANGTDTSSVYKSDIIKLDGKENFYITDKGINYMNKVFSKYESFAGLIKDEAMVNVDKEIRAFAMIDKEIQNERNAPAPVINISDSQLHFGRGDNIGKLTGNPKESILSKYWWGFIIPIIVGVIVYLVAQSNSPNISNNTLTKKDEVTTSTINISDLFYKALKLETVVEKQDFLNKYIGTPIYGMGVVQEVSRTGGGGGFLVDIREMNNQIVTCPQEGGEENERRLLLLKGKNISFTGVFTYRQIVGYGLAIGSCSIK